MNIQILKAELLKNKRSRITWITFFAFALAPIFGGIFMLLMQDNGYDGLPGAVKTKVMMMSFDASWNSFLSVLSQAMGIGGIILFGFIASWLFGREYTDRTVKDLLALPVSRSSILNSKFIIYFIWCFALAISNLIFGLLIGFLLNLDGLNLATFIEHLTTYFTTTILVILLGLPVAYFAIIGKGYLVPLGFVVVSVILAQILGILGVGNYFPWAVPGIYGGSGGEEMKTSLNIFSYLIILIVSIIGYFITIRKWNHKDHNV